MKSKTIDFFPPCWNECIGLGSIGFVLCCRRREKEGGRGKERIESIIDEKLCFQVIVVPFPHTILDFVRKRLKNCLMPEYYLKKERC